MKKIVCIVLALFFTINLAVLVGCKNYNNTNNDEVGTEYPQCLVGEVVYNIGRGLTPDLTFKSILQSNNVEYVESDTPVEGKVALHYVDDGTTLIGLLSAGVAKYGIMGEPAVSTALTKIDGAKIVLDIQQQWQKTTKSENLGFPQASVFVGGEILQSKTTVDGLIDLLKQGDSYAVENTAEAVAAVREAGSVAIPQNMTKETAQRFSLNTKTSTEAKQDVNAYLSALSEFNVATIGGKLPNDNFFYNASQNLEQESENKSITVIVPDGTPCLALGYAAKNNSKVNGYSLDIQIVSPGTLGATVATAIKNGDNVLAIMPTNAGATLYNKGTSIQLAAVSIWGVLYMLAV